MAKPSKILPKTINDPNAPDPAVALLAPSYTVTVRGERVQLRFNTDPLNGTIERDPT